VRNFEPTKRRNVLHAVLNDVNEVQVAHDTLDVDVIVPLFYAIFVSVFCVLRLSYYFNEWVFLFAQGGFTLFRLLFIVLFSMIAYSFVKYTKRTHLYKIQERHAKNNN